MKPLITVSILDSINLMSKDIISFTENLLKGLKPNIENIKMHMERNLMSVTKLAPIIGYDKAEEFAIKAHETNKTTKEIVSESDLKNKEEAKEYEKLKVNLARKFPSNREEYTKAKGPFIEKMISEARSQIPSL